ncbi:peroxisome assembly protein 12-B [Topomyia yanbarensis]|uniref:peroxisome assembly protein 12-B n=1 Tax=Topomyia yanbarensis TaxID=2498891 RepID=UPI00273AFD7B|nr:peroxisome assembly protein 12-B [Topomyia yanbarensis]XP_058830055.1 peroxisome assembly protein 12-B [Topomyia yanbarensis]
MAAKGAHITQNIEARPSVFEVIAADSLNSTFYPALKRVANFLATIKPNTFGYVLRYYDEAYLVFNCVVQSYYLRNKGGSLSEVFYGLSRISPQTLCFDSNGKQWSLVFLVLIPYLSNKIEQKVQRWKDDCENNTLITPEKRLLVQIVPYLKACYESLKLFQYIIYLAGKSHTHSPVLRWLNLSLAYLPEEDEPWMFKDILSGQVKFATVLSSVLLRTLELSAFFLQFIEWWQNEANMGDLSKLPVPDSPQDNLYSEKYKNMCPLCLQKWIIPTAVSVSGYVYCYRCIVSHMQKKNECPVTKYPATISDLTRIFDDDD